MKLAHSSKPKQNQGIALIVSMIAIAVLMVLAFDFAWSMKVETHLAIHADAEQQMLWLGKSGVETARWILSNEALTGGQPFDSLNQIWAGGPGTGGETNSAISGFSLTDISMGAGTYSLKIVDLERKVNINAAPPPVLQQALTAMGADADSISTVVDSIGDWVDSDDAPRTAGAESDYYQGLTPAYYAKNAPIDDLSELLLIKGVTSAMFWGGSADDHSPAAFQRKLGLGHAPGQEPDYPFGLNDVFTALSSGRININTADANVLQTLPGIDTATAAAIIKQRAGPDGQDGTEDDTPFVNVSQLQQAGVDPQIVGQLGQLCDVRSQTFEVHVTAQIGNFQREYVAVLWRSNPNDIQVLSFRWK
jgi:general secretion pathway protein K